MQGEADDADGLSPVKEASDAMLSFSPKRTNDFY